MSAAPPSIPADPMVADWSSERAAPVLRLVLPRAKRDRLARRIGALAPRRACAAPGCAAEALAVLLVEDETEAVLCPRHQLVDLDGRPVAGQPMFATAAW